MGDVRTGFARSDDGLQLYWRAAGNPAAHPLVCCNGVGVSTFFWKYVVQHYREHFHVIVWDYRGHGLSGMPPDVEHADLTIERSARDLECVLRHAGVHEPVVLFGHSMGCQVILEYAKQAAAQGPSTNSPLASRAANGGLPRSGRTTFGTPSASSPAPMSPDERPDPAPKKGSMRDRVRAIVPMFGTFGRPLDTFLDNPQSRRYFEVVHKLTDMGGRSGARMLRPLYASPLAFELGRRTGLVDRYYASREDVQMYLDHLNHMDVRVFMRMVAQMADHDLEPFLPEIDVPMLIVAGEKDLFTPLHRSRRMLELVPGAEMIVLPEGSHAAIVEHPETINRRVDRFLAERVFPTQAAQAAT